MLPLSDLFGATNTLWEGLPEAVGFIILLILPFLVGLVIKFILKVLFRIHNLRCENLSVPAREVAEKFLYKNLIQSRIRPKNGVLTDCYDPDENTLWLSNAVYYGTSPVSYAIALHEVGHAIQHKEGNKAENLRTTFGGFGVFLAIIAVLAVAIGLFFNAGWAFTTGLIALIIYLLISIVTVIAEVDASRKARAMLDTLDIPDYELRNCKKLLRLCYWTYIVTVLTTISAIVLLLFLSGSQKRK